MDITFDFETYWTKIGGDIHFADRKAATELEWNKHPDKHKPIILWLVEHGKYPQRNPFFFIQDFKIKRPKGQPEWKTGGETGEDLVQVKYNGLFKICTRQTMEDFKLEYVRDW